MASVSDLIGSGLVAGKVLSITGNRSDAAAAAGYSAWVNSITGDEPRVLQTPDNRVQVVLSQAQIAKMQQWFDSKLWFSFAKKEKPKMEIVFSPVIMPWAMKYGIPIIAASFIAGWLARNIIR